MRSRATGEFCRAALYGQPRTAAGEKVGLAIQLNRKRRREDCSGTEREREGPSFLPSMETPPAVQTLVVSGSRLEEQLGRRRERSSWGLESSPGES